MRTRVGVALIVAALTLGGSLVAVSPAGAAAVHTITATPDTGLHDGQVVSVTGTGFDETPAVYSWFVTTCDSGMLDSITLENALLHCDITSPVEFVSADQAGNINTTYAVHTSYTVGGQTRTCGQSPGDCVLLLSQLATTGFVGAATPISFGSPVKTVAECFRDFAHDHSHSLRYRLRTLLACVVQAVRHHQPH